MRQTPTLGLMPLVLCMMVFSIGATIFSGWLLHMPVLLKIFSGQVAMKPNAALGFILCSITTALVLQSGLPKAARPVLAMVSLGVTGLAILTLSQDIFGWNLGIDEWLFRDMDQSGRTAPGRISPPASFCFALIGLALATLSLPVSRPLRLPVISALGTATVIVSVLSLGGHLINVIQGNRSWNFSPVSVDAALSFLMLGAALLLVVREKGGLARHSGKAVVGGFAVGIAALLITASTAYYFVRQLQLNAVSAAHSREVLERVEILRRNLSESANNLRGYVISGDERLALAYGQNLVDTGKAFQALRNLLAEDPKQLAQVEQVMPLRAVMDDLHSRILAERRTHGFAAARQLVLQSEGALLDSQVNRVLDQIREYASRYLQDQQTKFTMSARETFLTLPMGVFVSITTLLLGLFLLDSSTGERLRMQEARRDSDALFRAIFEATPDGIIMSDASRNIVMTNPGADKMFGYGPGDLLGSPVTRVFSGLEIDQIRREREDLLAHQGTSLTEPAIGRAWQLDGIRHDNSHFPTEVIRSAFTLPRGTFVIGVTRDMTARVKMQDDLLQREAGLHAPRLLPGCPT